MRQYVRARLHRRLFWMMGLAIVGSFSAAFLTLHAFSHDDWETRERLLVGFAVGRFADVWQNDERRQLLADEAVRGQPCRSCAALKAASCSGVASRWCRAFQSANGMP